MVIILECMSSQRRETLSVRVVKVFLEVSQIFPGVSLVKSQPLLNQIMAKKIISQEA